MLGTMKSTLETKESSLETAAYMVETIGDEAQTQGDKLLNNKGENPKVIKPDLEEWEES